MGAGDLELLDVLSTDASEDDEPRLKVGDLASGKGVGQDCVVLAPAGFGGMPNPPSSGACGQAVCWTPGDDRLVIACADNRFNAKAGTLTLGDCWCTSNCDAALKLTRAANKIEFLALAQGMSLSLDANAQEIDAIVGHARALVTASGCALGYNDGTVDAFANATGAGVVLSFTAAALTCSVTLGPGGTVAIVCTPGAFTVNGVPVTVP